MKKNRYTQIDRGLGRWIDEVAHSFIHSGTPARRALEADLAGWSIPASDLGAAERHLSDRLQTRIRALFAGLTSAPLSSLTIHAGYLARSRCWR